MNAYHNDEKLKEATVAEMQLHREQDHLVKGQYWEALQGCAVGCLSKDPNGGHAGLSAKLGIPEWLLRLEDGVFENLPNGEAMEWPVQFLSAIPVGADLDGVVKANIMCGILDACVYEKNPKVKAVIEEVRRLYIVGGTDDEWSAARSAARSAASAARRAAASAAWSAARSAEWSAARSAAESAARSAAWSAASAAESAAGSAAWSAAWSAAASAVYQKIRDLVLSELSNAPVGVTA